MRPTIFNHAYAAMQSLPYTCVDGDGRTPTTSGGVLKAGEVVWTQTEYLLAGHEDVLGYNHLVGTILVSARGLVRAEISPADEDAREQQDGQPKAERSGFEPAREEIAKLAYAMWERKGRPEGVDGNVDWLDAEGELRALGPQVLR